MDKLWSPWRSQYIESFKDDSRDNSCIFCDMLDKNPDDDSNLLVDNSDKTFTVLNLFPYNNGHLMIVPKRHLSKLSELTKKENSEIMQKLQLAEKVLNKVLKPQGFNAGANLGRVSGAGIEDHIHFHIVPRWNGDTNFMPVLGEVKVISQDLKETKRNLRKIYIQLSSK